MQAFYFSEIQTTYATSKSATFDSTDWKNGLHVAEWETIIQIDIVSIANILSARRISEIPFHRLNCNEQIDGMSNIKKSAAKMCFAMTI